MENKILLQDLAQDVATHTSIQKKDADNLVRNIFDVIIQFLHEDKIVKIKGLGTFKVVEVSGRDSVNVNTGERIHISGHSKITFTPDTVLRDYVNRPFADFETIIINDGADMEAMERLPEPELPDTSEIEETAASVMAGITDDEADSVAMQVAESTVELKTVDEAAQNPITQVVTPVPEETEVDPVSDSVLKPVQETLSEPVAESVQEPVQNVVSEPASQPNVQTENSIMPSVDENQQAIDKCSTENLTDSADSTGKEKIIYVEKRPCRFCRVCFVLLTLALMALSYLAGYQRWFCAAEQTPEQLVNTVIEKSQTSPTKSQPAVIKPDTLQADSVQKIVSVEQATAEPKPETPAAKPQSTAVESKAPVSPAKPQTQVLPDGNYEITGTRCTHVMKSGEGLYRLARIYYGNKELARYIIKYNHISNPDIVSEGSVIKIPELQKVQ